MTTSTNTKLNKMPKINAISVVEDFAHIYKEWHPTKNFALNPDQIAIGSMKSVWWQCSINDEHVWDMSTFARTKLLQGCPFCSGRRTDIGRNDLASQYPQIAIEWDYDLNSQDPNLQNVTPENVASGSNKKVNWIGQDCGHKWKAIIQSRTKGSNKCPYCANRKVLEGFNDLASSDVLEHQNIVAEWHEDNDIKPTEVLISTNKRVKWRCAKNDMHVWEAYLPNRTLKLSGCPHCHRDGNKSDKAKTQRLADIPLLAKEYHSTKNKMNINTLTSGSGKKVWWQCSVDPRHEWEASISNRVRGSKCLVCLGRLVIEGVNDLASHTKFQYLVEQWHEDNALKPTEVIAGSTTLYLWKCELGHEWKASVYTRIRGNQNCPICSGRTGDEVVTLDNFPELMEEWHPDNTLDPKTVSSRGAKMIKWQCQKDHRHEWEASSYKRAIDKSGCPVCSGLKVIPGVNDLASYDDFSHLVQQWHKDNDFAPTEVSVRSNKMIKWKCDTNAKHVWTASLATRTRKLNPTGCPECAAALKVSKGEQEIADILKRLGLNVQQSVRSIIKNREIDIFLPDYNFAIEFNGLYWHSSAVRTDVKYHHNKWRECQQKNITLYQVWEDDWKNKKNIVISGILHRLNLTHRIKEVLPDVDFIQTSSVGARQLTPQEIKIEQARSFFDTNHIQGFTSGSFYLGLLDAQNNVRAAFVLNKDRSGGSIVISRYAATGNVIGGFTKLLSYAEKNDILDIKEWKTFADLSVSNGELYSKNGFVIDSIIAPAPYFIWKGKRLHWEHFPKSKFQKDATLIYKDGLTVLELAELNSINIIWDSGKYRYKKVLDE